MSNLDLIAEARNAVNKARTAGAVMTQHEDDLIFVTVRKLADALEAAEVPSKFLIHTDDCPHSRACACGLTAQVVTKESHPEVWARLQPPKIPLATLDAWDHAGRRPGEGSANPAP